LGSQKYFIVSDIPRNISVRNSVCAEASSTARGGNEPRRRDSVSEAFAVEWMRNLGGGEIGV
jgi:hypothetical protein